MNAYKVLILTNKLSFLIGTDCSKTTDFFRSRLPFPVSFEFLDVNIPLAIKPYKTYTGFSPTTGLPSQVTSYGLTDNIKDTCRTFTSEGKYDCVMFAYNLDNIPVPKDGVITSFTNYLPLFPTTEFIQLALNEYLKNKGELWHRISHELMHAFSFKISRNTNLAVDEMDVTKTGLIYYKNDDPEAVDGNYALTLNNLKPYFDKIISNQKYTYFKENEVVGLKPELVEKLDRARGLAGILFKITSGFRTPQQNASVGGQPLSAHLSGEAADLACSDSQSRLKMVKALLEVGFTRIEVAQAHIHVDVSKTLPQNVFILSDKD